MTLHPHDPGALTSLGCNLKSQKKFSEAEQCFRKAIETAPATLEPRLELAFLLAETGGSNKSLDKLDKCPENHKQTLLWKLIRGRALLVARRPQEAINFLLECANAGFRLGRSYLWLAEAYSAMGDRKRETEARKRAKELETNLPDEFKDPETTDS